MFLIDNPVVQTYAYTVNECLSTLPYRFRYTCMSLIIFYDDGNVFSAKKCLVHLDANYGISLLICRLRSNYF